MDRKYRESGTHLQWRWRDPLKEFRDSIVNREWEETVPMFDDEGEEEQCLSESSYSSDFEMEPEEEEEEEPEEEEEKEPEEEEEDPEEEKNEPDPSPPSRFDLEKALQNRMVYLGTHAPQFSPGFVAWLENEFFQNVSKSKRTSAYRSPRGQSRWCMHIAHGGSCDFGKECHFAHRAKDLKPMLCNQRPFCRDIVCPYKHSNEADSVPAGVRQLYAMYQDMMRLKKN